MRISYPSQENTFTAFQDLCPKKEHRNLRGTGANISSRVKLMETNLITRRLPTSKLTEKSLHILFGNVFDQVLSYVNSNVAKSIPIFIQLLSRCASIFCPAEGEKNA